MSDDKIILMIEKQSYCPAEDSVINQKEKD